MVDEASVEVRPNLPFEQSYPAGEHMHLALDAGGIGTWEWNLASGEMLWSAQMFHNLGLAPGGSVASFELLISISHPEDRYATAAALELFRTRCGPMRVESRFVWPDGSVHWMVFLGEVVADAAGRPDCMRGITIDSTTRRRAEETAEAALRESEARLRELNEILEQQAQTRGRELDASRAQMRAVFDVSPDWLTLFRATPNGQFIYEDLNQATERGYGLSRAKVVGRPLEDIIGAEAAQVPLTHMRECVRTGENQRYVARRTMAGVTRTVDVLFARVPEKYDGDYFLMATARDLTEREAMEQQLRQAQKMESVGQLTGGLAHDFNNLLTTIIGNLELLAPRIATDLRAANYLRAAQRAAESGAKLTSQLLAFSRRQHLQPVPVDLNAAITGMREILARTIGPNIEVKTVLDPELWLAMVDPTQIEIAILNLAINSRDAMASGGTMTIEAANLRSGVDAVPPEMSGRDCIRVSVCDTGSGMTDEVLRLAVEPFFTTKEVGKGSGLGLSQVYGTVQQSDGHLIIESSVGAGTAVHLYLPRALASAAALAGEMSMPVSDAVAARLLVVDDDPGVREITVQMLRELGYGVAEAGSGQAAIEAWAAGEEYDLVIIDVAMPSLNGIETIRRIREFRPKQRALYISGYVDNAGSEPQTGSDPMLKKPFKLHDLEVEVAEALNREPADNVVLLRAPTARL